MKLFGKMIVSVEVYDGLVQRHEVLREELVVLQKQRDQSQRNYLEAMSVNAGLIEKVTIIEDSLKATHNKLDKANLVTQNQLARINNTNDKLRHFGKAIVEFGAHIGKKPEGKVPPKERIEWNARFNTLWTDVCTAQITRVTDFKDLSPAEKDEAVTMSKAVTNNG